MKMAPKRRFKGFTEPWEERKLGELVGRYDNLRIPVTASNRISGDTPYYGANGIQDYVEGFTHNGEFVLIAEDGANDLSDYPVYYVSGKVWVNNHAHVVQAVKGISNNKFIKYSFKIINIEPYLVGGSRAKLNANVMMDLIINTPIVDEQEKIGAFFSYLDNLTILHQRKFEKLQALKKAYLVEMFPQEGEKVPRIRFEGFTGSWEECKLSDGTSKIGDGLHGTPLYAEDGDVYFINGNNLVNGKIVITEETKCVTEKEQSNDDKTLNYGTILMSINGTIGNLAFYNDEKLMLGKSVAYITMSDFDKGFVYACLQTPSIYSYFTSNLTGSTIKNLGLKTIRETKLLIPDTREQERIGTFFSNLDNLIALHQRKLEKLQALKKAYLAEMFV